MVELNITRVEHPEEPKQQEDQQPKAGGVSESTQEAGGQRPKAAEAAKPKAPVLATESADEFNGLQQQTEQEIGPSGTIGKMMANNICSISWEMRRLNRCKTPFITSEWRPALETVLIRVLATPGRPDSSVRDEAEALALGWFTDDETKKKVSGILARFELDESEIEAEATRRALPDLERLNKMLASLQTQLDKAIRTVCGYSEWLAEHLREVSERIIEGEKVVNVEPGSDKNRQRH
jgi:hypothetical protein